MTVQQRRNATIITAESAGTRLDLYLANRFHYHNRSAWQKEIENGRVTVNGQPIKITYKLRENDEIVYTPEPVPEPEVDFNYRVVFEDDDLMVVDKPGNLPCHPAGKFFNNTLWAKLKETRESIHFINRLDRETSGLMLISKSKKANKILSKQLEDGGISKRYQVVVHGKFDHVINAVGWMGKDHDSELRKKQSFYLHNLKPENDEVISANTLLTPIIFNEKFSLVGVKLGTGRMHQIRCTLFSLGFPVYGDKIYGLDENIYLNFIAHKMCAEDWQLLQIRRQALHASGLSFVHPISQTSMEFHSEFPKEILVKTGLAD